MKVLFFILFFTVFISSQEIVEVFSSKEAFVGIAVSKEERIFISYPRLDARTPVSVAEVLSDGTTRAYPDKEWNGWFSDLSPRDRFVSVTGFYIDQNNYLWILDTANPQRQGVLASGAKLIKTNLFSNTVEQVYFFSEQVTKKDSYFSNVRIDETQNIAYIADSGDGAIVILNLNTGKSRRLLDEHTSTHSEGVTVVVNDKPWMINGKSANVHCNGIALDFNKEYLYYQALTSKNLYRIRTKALLSENLSDEELAKYIQLLGPIGPADGIAFDHNDNVYLSGLEHKAVLRLTPALKVEIFQQDSSFTFIRNFAIHNETLYFVNHNEKDKLNKIYKMSIASTKRKQNEVISFIYHWYSLLDKNAPVENFVSLLSGTSLYMEFPDTSFSSIAAFRNWYSLVLSQIKEAQHQIKNIHVASNEHGNFEVEVHVHWQAQTHDNNTLNFNAIQTFTLIETEEEYPRLTRYIVKEAPQKRMVNNIREKIKQKQAVFGGFVTIADPKIVENMNIDKQLDFFWLEAEHTEMNVKEVQNLVRSCENENTVSLVRVPENGVAHIKPFIGTGVKGIIIPGIKNAEDAQIAVNATKYPPLGQRTIGVERSNRYLAKLQEYFLQANDVTMTILMIETPEAVENIEEIAQIKGVDLWHIGPFDLSVALGVPMESAQVQKAILRVEQVAQKYNIPLGSYVPSLSVAEEKTKKGYLFFTIPGDMQMLQSGVQQFFEKK